MKILIISHTPVSTQNNMGKTFRTMFSSFHKDELCQLYIYPSYPDEPYCSSFYRVTDKDVLKKINPGEEVSPEKIHIGQTLYENRNDESFYRNVKNKSAFRRMARDGIWAVSNWYNKKLIDWLDKENPTCIFLAPGPAQFIYSMALKISKERSIPIVTYICDEYYFVKPETDLLSKIRLGLFKKTVEKTIKSSKQLVTISEEMKEQYYNKFFVDTTVLMTGSRYIPKDNVQTKKSLTSISYFGNIRLNRNQSLSDIGRALDHINDMRGTEYTLNIYTGERDNLFLSAFDGIKSIRLSGFLSGEEFDKAVNSSDILLHTEAFDEESIDRVRHSVSTKIADSLASGIPMFAYGPENVSSMQHLIRHKCAVVCTVQSELEESLCDLFEDHCNREKCVANALKTSREYHCASDNSDKLYSILSNL